MKHKIFVLFLITISLFLAVSCSHDVYRSVWTANGKDFDTFSEALASLMGSKSISRGAFTKTEIITLNVSQKNGEGIMVPREFEGNLLIDFGGNTYEFSNDCDYFFDIRGGSNVCIVNGTTIIHNEAKHEPYALYVDTDRVTVDTHLIDDRRIDPRLLDITPNGNVLFQDLSKENGIQMKGDVRIATDGSNGALFTIQTSVVEIDNLITVYDGPEGIVNGIPSTLYSADDDEAKPTVIIMGREVTLKKTENTDDFVDGRAQIIIYGNDDEQTTVYVPYEDIDLIQYLDGVVEGDNAIVLRIIDPEHEPDTPYPFDIRTLELSGFIERTGNTLSVTYALNDESIEIESYSVKWSVPDAGKTSTENTFTFTDEIEQGDYLVNCFITLSFAQSGVGCGYSVSKWVHWWEGNLTDWGE